MIQKLKNIFSFIFPCFLSLALLAWLFMTIDLQAYVASHKMRRHALHDRRRDHFLFDQFFNFMALADFNESGGA